MKAQIASITLLLFSSSALTAGQVPDSVGDLNAHLNVAPLSDVRQARIDDALKITSDIEPFEQMPAGKASVKRRHDTEAFSLPSASLSFDEQSTFKIGNALFKKIWVSSPASTPSSDGLGPMFNARSCQRCHLKDGRGHVPAHAEDDAVSFLMRVSIPGGPATGDPLADLKGYIATLPHPAYGTQLHDFSVQGIPAEYRLRVTYQPKPVTLADGTVVVLQRPTYHSTTWAMVRSAQTRCSVHGCRRT